MRSRHRVSKIAARETQWADFLSWVNDDRKGGKTSTKSEEQKGVRSTHQKSKSSIETWFKIEKGTSGYWIWTRMLDKVLNMLNTKLKKTAKNKF